MNEFLRLTGKSDDRPLAPNGSSLRLSTCRPTAAAPSRCLVQQPGLQVTLVQTHAAHDAPAPARGKWVAVAAGEWST